MEFDPDIMRVVKHYASTPEDAVKIMNEIDNARSTPTFWMMYYRLAVPDGMTNPQRNWSGFALDCVTLRADVVLLYILHGALAG